MKKNFKRHLRAVLSISIIFLVLVFVVCLIALIVINHNTIWSAICDLPGNLLAFVNTLPLDWVVSGAICAALAFLSCGIYSHLKKKSNNK